MLTNMHGWVEQAMSVEGRRLQVFSYNLALDAGMYAVTYWGARNLLWEYILFNMKKNKLVYPANRAALRRRNVLVRPGSGELGLASHTLYPPQIINAAYSMFCMVF